VAIVTNVGSSDHLGLPAMDRNRMLLAERCGVDGVLADGTAVLNADDADVLAMAPKCRGKVLLFSRDADSPALVQHREHGLRTVALRGTRVCFEEGATALAELCLPHELCASALENLLAALGAAWALGLEPTQFALDAFVARATPQGRQLCTDRLHFASLEDRWLLLTMARNDSALRASLAALADRKESFARRVAIQTHLPTDWRHEDAFTAGQRLAEAFDEVRLLVETPLAEQNSSAASEANGQPGSPLVEAFARGVSSTNQARLVILPPGATVDRSTLLSDTKGGDLLFVQVGTFEKFASLALLGESSPTSASSSAAPRVARRHAEM
jgi:hypothetical protein